jgi:hypothetical protein
MTAWRTIITDSESKTGVAPVCESPEHIETARMAALTSEEAGADVFDCCPHPYIECWDETLAKTAASLLTSGDAEVCS